MIDPFTLIAGATAVYNGVKSAVDTGEDVMDTAHRIGDLMGKVAQIVRVASTPRKKKLFQSQADYEAEAMKLYAIKAKALQMSENCKNMFVAQYGRNAWDAIQRQVIELRKEAERQAAEELKAHEELQNDLIFIGSIVGGLIFGIGAIGLYLYLTFGAH